MNRRDIPAWCFLTGQFLIQFDKKKKDHHYSIVHRDFLKSTITNPPLDDFDYKNPGVVIMLCYSLLVYPVEYWNTFLKDGISMKRLNNGIVSAAQDVGTKIQTFTDLFNTKTSKTSLSQSDFIRKLRNAIAHANIKVDMRKNLFIFWNVKRNKDIDFEVSISTENIGIFLTGLGKHFINVQKRITS